MKDPKNLKINRIVAAPCAYSYNGNPIIGKVAIDEKIRIKKQKYDY
jgi:hypothetical protein